MTSFEPGDRVRVVHSERVQPGLRGKRATVVDRPSWATNDCDIYRIRFDHDAVPQSALSELLEPLSAVDRLAELADG